MDVDPRITPKSKTASKVASFRRSRSVQGKRPDMGSEGDIGRIDERRYEHWRLQASEKEIVLDAFYGPMDTVLISKFKLDITRNDLMTLLGGEWLNDKIVNFYMSLIAQRSEQLHASHGYPRVHAMNTFFAQKLAEGGYEAVKRWTRNVNIFAKEIVAVPIFVDGSHWSLAMIYIKCNLIRYLDSRPTDPGQRPEVLDQLRQYMKEESIDKRKLPFNPRKVKILTDQNTPQQNNTWDCGVYCLTFAELLSSNRDLIIRPSQVKFFRQKISYEILTGKIKP